MIRIVAAVALLLAVNACAPRHETYEHAIVFPIPAEMPDHHP